jgi:uridine phosphorylase
MTVGTYVAAQTSIGLDGVVYFYANNEQIRNIAFENELVKQLRWNIQGVRPYVVEADQTLVEQITQNDIAKGVTLTANGFYAPQGRMIRLPLHDPKLNEKITKFRFEGRKINNYEMESSALAALAKLMGHRAMTVCCIIAGRIDKKVNANYNHNLPHLIETVLQRI